MYGLGSLGYLETFRARLRDFFGRLEDLGPESREYLETLKI